jgi:hypothetical protein
VAPFKKEPVVSNPSLFSGRLAGGTTLVKAKRVGGGNMRWPRADA